MKRFVYISVFLAALIGTFALSSCKKDGMHSEKTAPQLFVTVFIPQPLVTKADVGTIRGYENERKINELVLWVFEHDKALTEPAFAT
ncbi:MAG: hypothetical protein IJ855_07625, partial [Bacteroidales bacterium]|nr:hypothetical protein [Bacteroidales bacterium]